MGNGRAANTNLPSTEVDPSENESEQASESRKVKRKKKHKQYGLSSIDVLDDQETAPYVGA